jgi:hypothetical protein
MKLSSATIRTLTLHRAADSNQPCKAQIAGILADPTAERLAQSPDAILHLGILSHLASAQEQDDAEDIYADFVRACEACFADLRVTLEDAEDGPDLSDYSGSALDLLADNGYDLELLEAVVEIRTERTRAVRIGGGAGAAYILRGAGAEVRS